MSETKNSWKDSDFSLRSLSCVSLPLKVTFSKTGFPIPYDFPIDIPALGGRSCRTLNIPAFAGLGTPHKGERGGLLGRTAHQIALRGEISQRASTRANLANATA